MRRSMKLIHILLEHAECHADGTQPGIPAPELDGYK